MLGWWKGHWIQAGGRCQGDSLGKWHILVGTAPGGTNGKEFTCQCRRHKGCGFDPGTGRSPGEENGKPLQYSCLENSMDRETWQAIVHRVSESQTRLKRLSTQACRRKQLIARRVLLGKYPSIPEGCYQVQRGGFLDRNVVNSHVSRWTDRRCGLGDGR